MISYNQLKPYGLNEKEAKVYLSALELGADSVQNIAKKAQIHRVSGYDILEKLLELGLVSETRQGKKRLFMAVEPEKFLMNLKNKQELFGALLPELKAIQNNKQTKPKILYFEGRVALWQAYFDRVRQPNIKENLVYGSSQKIVNAWPEEYKKFTAERTAKNILAKIIVERSLAGEKEKELAEKELREVKFLPAGKTLETNTIIYGDRVMIVSWQNLTLTIIEDKNYAESQRLVFNLLWENLK